MLAKLGVIGAEASPARVEEAFIRASSRLPWLRAVKRPKWILVVDMDGGRTQAHVLARAWASAAALEHEPTAVAYWDPQAQPVKKAEPK